MITHWMSNARIYRIYRWIISRCKYPSMNVYKIYWARWIKCLRNRFEDFYNDMWKSYEEHVREYWEKNTTIDRIDVNWNYCRENCRRATIKEQWNNTRLNIHIEYKWKRYKSIMELCEELWIKYVTLYKRVFIEWQDAQKAIDNMIEKSNKYKYKWVTYKWITELCRKIWVNRTSIHYRLKQWMDIEEAIEKEFRPYNKKDGQPL